MTSLNSLRADTPTLIDITDDKNPLLHEECIESAIFPSVLAPWRRLMTFRDDILMINNLTFNLRESRPALSDSITTATELRLVRMGTVITHRIKIYRATKPLCSNLNSSPYLARGRIRGCSLPGISALTTCSQVSLSLPLPRLPLT